MSDAESDERRAWFRRAVLPLEPELRAYAESLARPGQTEAADLVNDVLVKMITSQTWREIDSPIAYAKRVMRNLAFEAARRSKVVAFGVIDEVEVQGLVDEAPDAEAVAVSRDELRRLREAVASMPEPMRRIFTLRKVYDLSPPRIAEELGLSISSIEKYLTRGLRHCSERMANEAVAGPRRERAHRWARTRDRGGRG